MDTKQMVELCQQGNKEAFNQLYKRYYARTLRTAYLIVGRKAIAEDIVQEAFCQCYCDIKRLKHIEAFEAWFNKLLIRTCWSVSAKERKKEHTYLEENIAFQDNNKEIENIHINEVIHHAINQLSIPLRTTVILYYYNEMSIKQIAKTLNCLQGTVKSRLYAARKQIEKEMIENGLFNDSEQVTLMKVGGRLNESKI